jgi:hypothetical protein
MRIFASAASSQPIEVRGIDQGCQWRYNTVTWKTRPDQSVVLATLPSVRAGWNEFTLPVSSLTSPQRTGERGHACYYVTRAPTGVVRFDSVSAAHPAELVLR